MIIRRFVIVVFLILSFVGPAVGSQSTSSTAASTIITNARFYINEASANFWSDAELLVYLNDGMVDIATRARCLEDTETISLVADQVEYAPTSTFLAITAVQYSGTTYTKGLLPGSPKEVGLSVGEDSVGEPTYWYEWNDRVGAYPPLSSVTTEAIVLYAISLPSTLTADQNVTTPAIFDRVLTLYIAAQALYKDKKFGQAGRYMAEDMEEIERFRADFYDRAGIGKTE